MPEVPPIGDTIAGFETSSFYGVGAPHGTPQAVVDLLNKEINAALADPVIKQRLAELGAIPIAGNAGQFGAMLAVGNRALAQGRGTVGTKEGVTNTAFLGVARTDGSRYLA